MEDVFHFMRRVEMHEWVGKVAAAAGTQLASRTSSFFEASSCSNAPQRLWQRPSRLPCPVFGMSVCWRQNKTQLEEEKTTNLVATPPYKVAKVALSTDPSVQFSQFSCRTHQSTPCATNWQTIKNWHLLHQNNHQNSETVCSMFIAKPILWLPLWKLYPAQGCMHV